MRPRWALLVSGVASVLYLICARAGSRLAAQLPDRALLDRPAYRTAVLALPIWTFAIITGAIWAEAAWGRYWGWYPKETCALVAWVVYAGYLHARARAGGAVRGWLGQRGRLRGDAVQPVLRQHRYRRLALVCRDLTGPGRSSALVFRLLPLAIQTLEELRIVVRREHGAPRRWLWAQRLP